MAMTTGTKEGISSEINVTPLIEVLLVLLIVFMLIVPVVPRGLSAAVPQPSREDQADTSNPIVVSVMRTQGTGLEYSINQHSVPLVSLRSRLADLFARRADRTMFVKGDGQVEFIEVAEVIDAGHAAGADRIGLITPKVEEGL